MHSSYGQIRQIFVKLVALSMASVLPMAWSIEREKVMQNECNNNEYNFAVLLYNHLGDENVN